MRYKTLFRVLLKLIGVWLFAQGLIGASWWIWHQFLAFFAIGSPSPYPYTGLQSLPLHSVMGVGLGLYFFFGGKWIVDKAIPGNHVYCLECGYDLSHTDAGTCPECGQARSTDDL